jgi:hypothetical protein
LSSSDLFLFLILRTSPPPALWSQTLFQNHGVDIRKNPDCSIHLVLERCKAMLVACKPWFRPSVLSRTWCLYECMLALQAVRERGGVDLGWRKGGRKGRG